MSTTQHWAVSLLQQLPNNELRNKNRVNYCATSRQKSLWTNGACHDFCLAVGVWVTYETNFLKKVWEGRKEGWGQKVEWLYGRALNLPHQRYSRLGHNCSLSVCMAYILAFYAMGLRGNDITNNLWSIRRRWDCPRDLYKYVNSTLQMGNGSGDQQYFKISIYVIGCDIIEIMFGLCGTQTSENDHQDLNIDLICLGRYGNRNYIQKSKVKYKTWSYSWVWNLKIEISRRPKN